MRIMTNTIYSTLPDSGEDLFNTMKNVTTRNISLLYHVQTMLYNQIILNSILTNMLTALIVPIEGKTSHNPLRFCEHYIIKW